MERGKNGTQTLIFRMQEETKLKLSLERKHQPTISLQQAAYTEWIQRKIRNQRSLVQEKKEDNEDPFRERQKVAPSVLTRGQSQIGFAPC